MAHLKPLLAFAVALLLVPRGRGSCRTAPAALHPSGHRALRQVLVAGNDSLASEPGAAATATAAPTPTKSPSEAGHSEPASSGSDAVDQAAEGAVKVYAEHTEPDYSQPWQRGKSHSSRSSGVMMLGPDGEPLVCTNAHSVEYATQVQVKRRSDDTRFEARVVAAGRDCDLALLAVDDETFWENATFARFGGLPAIRDRMTVVGFPIGGEQVSVTQGIVSRMEVTGYSLAWRELLALQIDASINPGNSGGPVFNDEGEVVGLAFQALTSAENIGYVVPSEIMAHFFEDVHLNGTFTGFPDLGLQLQRMESPALRAAYNMSEGEQGLLVRLVYPLGSCAGQVQQGDVLTKFDGVDVASDGTVPFRGEERIDLSYLVSQRFVGDTADVEVLRDGQLVQLQIQLKAPDWLVPVSLKGALPSYLMVGGLVINVLSAPFMFSEYGSVGGSPTGLQDQLWFGVKNQTDEQVLVLSQILASDATTGYERYSDIQGRNAQIHTFNGRPVRSLLQLAREVVTCEAPYMAFGVDHNEEVILETAAVQNATADVMAVHAIPSFASKDIVDALGKEGVLKEPTA
ncbi:protease Do-like 9 [Chlorella sorokiniana]|uniref:Protease Do-like 9 n=1 Tax=Chlorella sorokiniana TaxID=3076 RepID=A0A2P6TJV4_CHLSO|nr:protease Do-like 9 [Chlorella sorokiniana]|eukprot:PRW44318.1 protease Do-like 9 [Chlorella sorokiniana]